MLQTHHNLHARHVRLHMPRAPVMASLMHRLPSPAVACAALTPSTLNCPLNITLSSSPAKSALWVPLTCPSPGFPSPVITSPSCPLGSPHLSQPALPHELPYSLPHAIHQGKTWPGSDERIPKLIFSSSCRIAAIMKRTEAVRPRRDMSHVMPCKLTGTVLMRHGRVAWLRLLPIERPMQ